MQQCINHYINHCVKHHPNHDTNLKPLIYISIRHTCICSYHSNSQTAAGHIFKVLSWCRRVEVEEENLEDFEAKTQCGSLMNVPHPTMDCCSKLCFSKSSQKSMRSTKVLIFCVFGVASLAVWCVMCEVSCKVHGGPLQTSEARLVGSGWRMGPKWGAAELIMSSSMIPMVRIPYWALFFCCYTELNQNTCHTTCCGISSNDSNQQSCCRFRAICQMDKGREAILDWTKE